MASLGSCGLCEGNGMSMAVTARVGSMKHGQSLACKQSEIKTSVFSGH